MRIRVYTTKNCSNCEKLKKFLQVENVHYEEVDMSIAEALTELRINEVFTKTAPVLQVNSAFLTYEELFNREELKRERIKEVIGDGDRKKEKREKKGI